MPLVVAKKGKRTKQRFLGPATIAKPALFAAGLLYVVQVAMKIFLKA
jgi:hypothetical protein